MPPESASAGFETYVQLIWYFTVIVTLLMLFLCYLYLAMRRANEQELDSLNFTSLVIDEIEKERRRISRELHDTVLPQLRGRAVGDQIRMICTDLMPPDFSRLSLKDSLAEACHKFTQRTGIDCACLIKEEVNFAPMKAENQLHLFRMVQEALNNIEKHSQAQKASLVVRNIAANSPGNILICISDDGIGMTGKGGSGLGLRSMRQRASIIGAKLFFMNESGNGLMVRIEINPGKQIAEKA